MNSSLLKDLIIGVLYGDVLMRVLYRVRPYEQQPGSANALYKYWVDKCRKSILAGRKQDFKDNIYGMVKDFDH